MRFVSILFPVFHRELKHTTTVTATRKAKKKKTLGLDWQNNYFARDHAFVYISLSSLHDYNVKVPNFTFCRRQEHKATIFFFFS